MSFSVDSCALAPDPAEPEAARALLSLAGSGTTSSGVPFTVEAQRFATTVNEVTTFTDTVSYTDSARILQAQRIEVNGQVNDLREPDATTPLLRASGQALTASGLAGAPGDGADAEGIVGFALAATCP